MNFNLREPNPGDRISANLIREIVRAIRALTPIPGHGMKTSTGPNGTVYSSDAKPRASKASQPSCFDIRMEDEGVAFDNRFFSVGSKVYEIAEDETYDFENVFACLEIDTSESICSAQIVSYPSVTDIRNAANDDDDVYIVPLYHLGENGCVLCDMRNMPAGHPWEFDS